MTQALQAVEKPDQLLNDMLRVGKQAIITFPNFAHWKTRSYLFFKGQMPVSEALPYSWYDTPNIHLCTFRDFEALCQKLDIKILNRLAVDDDQQGSFLMKYLPNLMGEVAIYRVSR
jgi:methionine biosynthesis protein MetW